MAGEPPLLTTENYSRYNQFRDEWWVTNNLLTKGGSGFTSLLQTRYRELRRQVLAEDTPDRGDRRLCERQLDASGVLIREQERWPSGAQSDSTAALKGYIRPA